MQKKMIKYSLSILLIFLVAFNSVYFKKLDEVKLASSSIVFDASTFAHSFYSNKLLPHLDSAIKLNQLISLLKSEADKTFKDYSHAFAIGNIRYFLVQGEGIITSIDEDAISVALKNDSAENSIKIATEFVYGNAIRDASGLLNLNDFSNMSDFNSVSGELNKIVRQEVLPPFKARARQGDVVKFTGAIELNQAHLKPASIEVVPIQLSILK